MTAYRLAAILLKYHVYSHAVYGLSHEEVLRMAKMDVLSANYKEK